MTKFAISSGHGKLVRGASGVLDEVDEARRVVDLLASMLGADVVTFHDDVSTSQNENLNRIVDWHNDQERDLDISVHFNAFEDTDKPMGCEVLYVTQFDLAEAVSEAMAEAGGLINRGPKQRTDLFFLNNTEKPSILIEVVFVDSEHDAARYNDEFEAICAAIGGTISGLPIEDEADVEIDVEETPEVDLSGDNAVVINGSVEGDVRVVINGSVLREGRKDRNVVDLQITLHGDVTLRINGQDFHNKPTIPANQCNITASVFGGEDDYNVSAYDENKVLNDTDFYVALPDRFEGERPLVKVHNRASGVSATAEIWDVGPWNTSDDYWAKGTRPQAESGTDEKGRTTNGAGIDLSPALADKIGIDGMGTVDWEFVKS